VAFDLPAAGPASLEIFDVTGRRIRALVDGPLPAGSHALTWNGRDDHGSDVASGVYFVVLNAGGNTVRTKLVRLQ
jgi:flagellar hook assembly protein FlgD